MTGPAEALQGGLGLLRSCLRYRLGRRRQAAMDALYRRFLAPGGLAFDIGAHVGDRVASFRRLGCRVVAVEPQPGPLRVLRLLHGRDPAVALEACALGAAEGALELRLNPANPTVATASPAFVAAAAGAPGWQGQRWQGRLRVPATTLDALIARHGRPDFVKIDVEGWEAEVLAGLSQPLPALSFEFTTIQRPVALACLQRLAALGPYRFAAALGESQRLLHPAPLTAEACAAWLEALPPEANSGDVYACLEPARLGAAPSRARPRRPGSAATRGGAAA